MPAKKKAARSKAGAATAALYTLKVSAIRGPATREFVKRNPVVSRTIEIPGEYALAALHSAIFKAFDRYDEHLYEFQLGKRPQGRDNRCFGCGDDPWGAFGGSLSEDDEGSAFDTEIGSLGLRPRQAFWYWFDFGDDWWHRIDVVKIGEVEPGEEYPRVIESVGESPPQYPGAEEWEEDEG